jgi:hypothetical protein
MSSSPAPNAKRPCSPFSAMNTQKPSAGTPGKRLKKGEVRPYACTRCQSSLKAGAFGHQLCIGCGGVAEKGDERQTVWAVTVIRPHNMESFKRCNHRTEGPWLFRDEDDANSKACAELVKLVEEGASDSSCSVEDLNEDSNHFEQGDDDTPIRVKQDFRLDMQTLRRLLEVVDDVWIPEVTVEEIDIQ